MPSRMMRDVQIALYDMVTSTTPESNKSQLGIGKDCLDIGDRPMISRELVHNPIDHVLQGLGFHSTTGFADGRQRPPSPVLRTGLLQRAHQETVRCADEIHVAGLPLAAAHLAVSQPQLLLAVPMKRLGACPTMPIHQHHPYHFPP